MATFLIVNDDSADSPLLAPLAERLAEVGQVRIAVPAEEMSWKAKAMTRYGVVRTRKLEGYPGPAYAVEGTPSDCTNLGVFQLFDGPPDWVVSGINVGINAGMNFVINSGTVGAALEAAISGVPAVAFSVHLPPPVYRQWAEHREMAGPEAERMIDQTTRRTVRMMTRLVESGLPPGAMMLNINFPSGLTPETAARWVPMLENRYGSIFKREGEGFVHAYRGDSWHDDRPGDKTVVQNGEISVTALSLRGWSLDVGEPFPL